MEIILLEKILNLGNLGDMVRVKPGYGRNYLIPKGKAVPGTKENIEKFEEKRAALEKVAVAALDKSSTRAESISKLSITLKRKVGEEGKLYGSVGTADISKAVTDTGVELAKSEVRLPDGPLRQTGEFNVEISLHADVITSIQVIIAPDED